jgi:hypothetical protein
MSATTLPDLNLLPAEALKALIRAQHEQLLSRESEIEHLKLLLAKLQRMQFGRKSEKLTQQIEQLELRLEELQSRSAESAGQPEGPLAAMAPSLLIGPPAKPARREKLMRHSDVRTTMNTYGDVVTDEMAEANSKVAGLALNGM